VNNKQKGCFYSLTLRTRRLTPPPSVIARSLRRSNLAGFSVIIGRTANGIA